MGEQTGEYRSLDAMPGVAPPEQADGAALTIEVDGEAFECRPDGARWNALRLAQRFERRLRMHGQTDQRFCSLEDHRGFILNFLDQIVPATGFIGD